MAEDRSDRPKRFQTLEREGAAPREVMPTLPGDAPPPRPVSRARRVWNTLVDIRSVGATTQELSAVHVEEEAPIEVPMKSSLVPLLITCVVLLFVAAMVVLSR